MKSFQISWNDAWQRLDKFLKKLLKNSSLSLIYKLNRKNKVKVNSKRQDNEYKIQEWDEIKLFLSDSEFDMLTSEVKTDIIESWSPISKEDIIYEDGDLLVLNKNPWISVHPWDHKTKDVSLIQKVHDYLWNKLNSLTFKPSLVHRIDKDTSWAIIIAKNKKSLDFMLKELQEWRINKKYIAITKNIPSPKEWTITKKLYRIEWAKNENKIVVDEDKWQKAITHYKTIDTLHEWKYGVIECVIETWRMHQIRVHLSSISCPILWDSSYGDKKENSFVKTRFGIARQMLHAHELDFIHPTSKKRIKLKARLKEDMKNFIWKDI